MSSPIMNNDQLQLLQDAVQKNNEGVRYLASGEGSCAVAAIPLFKCALASIHQLMRYNAVTDSAKASQGSSTSSSTGSVSLQVLHVAIPSFNLEEEGFYIYNQAFSMELSPLPNNTPSSTTCTSTSPNAPLGSQHVHLMGTLALFNLSLAFHHHGLHNKASLLHANHLYEMCLNLVSRQPTPVSFPLGDAARMRHLEETSTSTTDESLHGVAILLILLVCLIRNNLAHITHHTQSGLVAQQTSMTFLVQAYSVLAAASPSMLLGGVVENMQDDEEGTVGDGGVLIPTCANLTSEVFFNMLTVCASMAMAPAA